MPEKITSLEALIRDRAARGDISHISLTPSQDGKLWRASYAPCSVFGVTHSEDKDPIKAIILALSTTKIKSRAPVRLRDEQETVNAIDAEVISEELPASHPAHYPAQLGGDPSIPGHIQHDEYLAGIAAKTAEAADDGLPDPCA